MIHPKLIYNFEHTWNKISKIYISGKLYFDKKEYIIIVGMLFILKLVYLKI